MLVPFPAMGTEKRERQKAGRQARREAEMKVAAAQRRKRAIIRGVVIAAVAIGLVLLFSVFAGDDNDDDVAATASTTTAIAEGDTATSTTQAEADAAAPECPPEDASGPQLVSFPAAPPNCIDPTEKYVAHFNTSMGEFEVLLDPEMDEVTVNNFVFLARHNAYEGVLFHRIINDFMVQGGDVQFLGGRGGPGYSFTGGVPDAGQYRIGSIAMANSVGPSSNGSQFFIVTGPQGVGLPPNYSLFGQVISGIEVPLAMQKVETNADDAPLEDVVIESIEIRTATDDDIAAYDEAMAG